MGKFDWILDVLADLRTFAASNGLGALSEQLDDTILVAARDIGAAVGEADATGHGSRGGTGSGVGGLGGHRHA